MNSKARRLEVQLADNPPEIAQEVRTKLGKKPVVRYGTAVFVKEGRSALLWKVFGHNSGTVRGNGYVRTSPVVKIIREGSYFVEGLGQPWFETLNTIYKPRKFRA